MFRNNNVFLLYMKHNRKTLKRKSLLKKRKGGKTARRRMKKGGDFFKPSTWKNPFSSKPSDQVIRKTACIEGEPGCCLPNSPCPLNEQGHYWESPNVDSKILFDFQGRNTSYNDVVASIGTPDFKYCTYCLKIRCDPGQKIMGY